MASHLHSLNYQLPPELHLDKYAQQILDSNKHIISVPSAALDTSSSSSTISSLSTPTISSLDAYSADLWKKLGVSLLNTFSDAANQIQIAQSNFSSLSSSTASPLSSNMELGYFKDHHVAVLEDYEMPSQEALDELQKQLDYDKFMNEVWIGVVMTLILISMVFCICSCFLYHQFRTWKRNYRSSVDSTQAVDIESLKTIGDFEDPVPEYTLVSGLPSYEAALELLHKTPKSCLIVYPSVFNVFGKNEKLAAEMQQSSTSQIMEISNTTPLLSSSSSSSALSSTQLPKIALMAQIPSYEEAVSSSSNSQKMPAAAATTAITITTINEKASHKLKSDKQQQ